MGHLARLVAAEILWLGQLHPKLCPHTQHRQRHANDAHEERQLDLPILAVADLVGSPLGSAAQTATLTGTGYPDATLLVLLHEVVGPHANRMLARLQYSGLEEVRAVLIFCCVTDGWRRMKVDRVRIYDDAGRRDAQRIKQG